MSSIQSFCKNLAKHFTEGDIEGMATYFVTPTLIYLGKKIIFVSDQKEMRKVLSQFRENLLSLNYAQTRFDNIGETIIGRNSVRVKLSWVDLDDRDRQIDARDTCFYCRRAKPGGWEITLTSKKKAPSAALLEGLPVG